jgi:AcrR family transcriptional regulator
MKKEPLSPQSAFDTRHRDRDQKRFAVLITAAELFLTKGYHLTRLDDVADRLRITKPALYNYFRSKHDILLGCHMLGHDLIDASLAEIEEAGGDGLTRLRALIRAYAGVMTQPFGMCLVRLDEHELNPKALAQVRQRRQSVNERFEAYLAQGIKDGSIYACDVRLTAFWLAGALNWISRWYKAGHRMSSGEIGDYFADNLTRGLSRAGVEPARGGRLAAL